VSGHINSSEGLVALPVYLVVDTSASLRDEIGSLNEAVAGFFRSLAHDPTLDDMVRLCLIEFSSESTTLVPLSDPTTVSTVPTLIAGGTTNYSAAFNLVRQEILADVAELKHQGFRVFRPLMFFLSDGVPTDPSWLTALDALRSPEFRQRPTIVAVGFGSADPAIIGEIGSGRGGAFMISDAISIREAIGSIGSALPTMLAATVLSSRSPGQSPQVTVPAQWLDLK
jgi:uncharacterized protein YegL